jgi:hypothetical protein
MESSQFAPPDFILDSRFGGSQTTLRRVMMLLDTMTAEKEFSYTSPVGRNLWCLIDTSHLILSAV